MFHRKPYSKEWWWGRVAVPHKRFVASLSVDICGGFPIGLEGGHEFRIDPLPLLEHCVVGQVEASIFLVVFRVALELDLELLVCATVECCRLVDNRK